MVSVVWGWSRVVAVACALAMLAGPVHAAEKRVALVLGNGAYEKVPKLTNPPADARAVAAALKGIGFTVFEGIDLTIGQMLERVHAFGQAAEGSSVALVFYAGHGMQVAGRNYLLPVDAKLERETDLRREAVEVDEILGEARQARRLRIVILDACRDNPFMAQMARSLGTRSGVVGRGFSRVEDVEADTLIAYATKADAVAEDGKGEHSPYTTALLKHIATPDLTVERFFGKVRDSVVEQTQGRQQPFVYGSLGGDPIYLARAADPAPPATAPAAVSAGADAAELAFWDAIKASANAADYQAYLDTYPNGRFAALAKVRARSHGDGAAPSAGRMVAPAPVSPPEPPPAPAAALAVPAAGRPPVAAGLECTRFSAAADLERCGRANAGDVAAAAALAAVLETGRGAERDEAEALRLYRLAADRGDPAALTSLGEFLEAGRATGVDEAAAARAYRAAASQGFARAQYDLGVLLEQGRGVARDEAEAASWYRKAAEQGVAEAQVTLGLMQEAGRGGARDLTGAARLYRMAAEHGNSQGQAFLAVLLEQGRGVPRDLAEAARLYRLAAAQGNALAQSALKRLGN